MEVNGSAIQQLLMRMNTLCDHLSESEGGSSSIPYTLTQLLEIAAEHSASSLYISAGSPPELRINGALSVIESAPLTKADCSQLLNSICNRELKARLYSTGQIETCISCSGSAFRVFVHLERGQMCAAFRRFRTDIPKLENLGLSGSVIENALSSQNGLILITGLPRSGKVNTLASMISHINTSRLCRIITLERPIDFWHYSMSGTLLQREIGIDAPSFAEGAKQALNQDADVIGISQISDKETLLAALKACSRGKLVIAIIDAQTSVAALQRIIKSLTSVDEGGKLLETFADSLRLVVHQTLVNRVDGRGVIPAFELLVGIQEITDELRQGKTDKIVSIMKQRSMQTLGKSIARLLSGGAISEAEALQYVSAENLQHVQVLSQSTSEYESKPMDPSTLEDTDTPLMGWL